MSTIEFRVSCVNIATNVLSLMLTFPRSGEDMVKLVEGGILETGLSGTGKCIHTKGQRCELRT